MKLVLFAVCLALATTACKKKINDCMTTPDPGPCTKEYAPVCGCDGETYGNECEAKRAGVLKWTDGKCK